MGIWMEATMKLEEIDKNVFVIDDGGDEDTYAFVQGHERATRLAKRLLDEYDQVRIIAFEDLDYEQNGYLERDPNTPNLSMCAYVAEHNSWESYAPQPIFNKKGRVIGGVHLIEK
jgi:hypothetical protein